VPHGADAEVQFGPDRKWWRGVALEWASGLGRIVPPSAVTVVDLTLREGEEYPDALLSVDDKLRLAQRIIAAGFTELEVGYAGVIAEHAVTVKALKQRWPDTVVISHARAYAREGEWEQEIHRSAEAGCDLLTFVTSVSDLGLASIPWLNKRDVPKRIADCVSLAKSRGLTAAFGLTDPIRTTMDDFIACYRAAADAGAGRLYVYDGVGGGTPEVMAGLVTTVRDATGATIPVGVHCHNTLGLSTANAIAAVRAGATVVDATPLGLGDGGGITAVEELVTVLAVLYGVDTGLRLEVLKPLCEEIAEVFGVTIPGHKAVVGRNLYRHQIDAHIAAILRGHWYTWELIRPDALGHTRSVEFVPGKIRPGRSGALGALLEQRHAVVTDARLAEIAAEVGRQATARRMLTDADVAEIIGRAVDGH
jgi:isopropylmalate/homocitrate/citramalate synthase